MAVKPGLHVRQSQRLALTPAMRLSVQVLSLSGADLNDLIDREMEQNPLLQRTETALGGTGEAYLYALDTAMQHETLAQSLCRQISLTRSPETTRTLAQYLASNLDEKGYLAISADEITKLSGASDQEIIEAIKILQGCTPTGVGARNLKECLTLQLREAGRNTEDIKTICDHLGLFSKHDWHALRTKTGRSLGDLKELFAVLQTLDPAPGRTFEPDQSSPLAPDVIVKSKPDGGFLVELANGIAPTLSIDAKVLQNALTNDPAAKAYLLAQRTAATDLIRAINGRFHTLLKVVEQIVLEQAAFFQDGPAFLKPLRRQDIAHQLGVHPSTVTRTLAHKTLECRFGVMSLDQFFSAALGTNDSEAQVSARSIQHRIAGLIAQETSEKILSDTRIATILRESGVDIARRTVAKYRQCLKIPSSAQRRRSKLGL